MTNLSNQLDRLLPALSGRERAILVLKTFKEGGTQDRRLGQNMLPAEAREYNSLIGLMNVCNQQLVAFIILVSQLIDKLDLKLSWLTSIDLWREHVEELSDYIDLYTKAPITQSELHKLQVTEGKHFAPVAELAEVMAESRLDWPEEDMEDPEEGTLRPMVWENWQSEKVGELESLVTNGTLRGKGKGRALRIELGSFFAWLGQEVPVEPDWGYDYEVFPDKDTALVAALKAKRLAAWKTCHASGTEEPLYHRLSEYLIRTTKRSLISDWGELLGLEAALEEVAEEFGGEDVLKPILRADMDSAKAKALELHRLLQEWDGPFDLPGADEEAIVQTRDLIARWASRG